jgi:ATP/maltotriose-dependent transcriptional regulator MalT
MSGPMVGREAELAATERFLDEIRLGARCLVFGGEPGIGKTTLWREAVRRGEARGYRVLRCRPAETETKLSFAGLADLLSEVDGVLERLVEAQRRALGVAVMRVDAGGRAPDRRTIFSAFASVLSVLAESGPLVLAVDDLQWLDASSRAALEFVVRRVGERPIGLLASVRLGDEALAATSFARVLAELDAEQVRLGPLSLGALHALIADRCTQAFARPTLLRIARVSRGNPFFALEIANELARRGELLVAPGEPLPVPDELFALVSARIGRLPARTREALLAAAALSQPTLDLLDAGALGRAEEANIVHVAGGDVSFVHPLFASAVYASAEAEKRQQLHRRLAGRLVDPEERARHLALAAPRADQGIAATLEAAAARARARGALDAAAELLELAVRLTPRRLAERRRFRSLAAAEYHFHAGDLAHARALVEEVLDDAPAGPARGHALRLLGEIRYHEDSFAEAIPLFSEALDELGDDVTAVGLRLNLAYARTSLGDLAGAVPDAHAALEQASRLNDDGLHAVTLAACAIVDLLVGRRADWERVEQALALEDPDRQSLMQMRPSLIAGVVLAYSDQLARARQLLSALRERTIERGEESDLPFLAAVLAMVERLRGDLRAAAGFAEEGYEIACQLGSKTMQTFTLAERCLARTIAGEVDGARQDAGEARRLAGETAYVFGDLWTSAALGFLETSLENAAAAGEALEPLAAGVELRGFCDPVIAFFLPDQIEALVALGKLERAARLTDLLEQHGRRQDRALALATAARCQSLLLAARGELQPAVAAIERALEAHAQLEMPLELGRTLLVKGRLERRARGKRAARDSFERALALFVQVGAPLWAERGRLELDRTHRRRTPPGELTPSEQRIAELAASGLTNRAIAERAFVSAKTVEANLARVYRKLGIHSRAELGRAMTEQEKVVTK